jgi:exodeoxyribonuclease-3
MKVRIASWNINSIRIRLELLQNVIKNNNIDVILLQETKCQDCDFPSSAVRSFGMNYLCKGQKSYNGVAILSKYPLELEIDKLPLYDLQDDDNEARYIEAITTINKKIIRIASVYVPMGGSVLAPDEKLEESLRFKYKLNFYKRLKKRIELLKHDTNNFLDEYVIFAGDLNVAQ